MMNAPKLGVCGVTSSPDGARCRREDRKGTWIVKSLRECLSACRACKHCRFVSHSLEDGDCECKMQGLNLWTGKKTIQPECYCTYKYAQTNEVHSCVWQAPGSGVVRRSGNSEPGIRLTWFATQRMAPCFPQHPETHTGSIPTNAVGASSLHGRQAGLPTLQAKRAESFQALELASALQLSWRAIHGAGPAPPRAAMAARFCRGVMLHGACRPCSSLLWAGKMG